MKRISPSRVTLFLVAIVTASTVAGCRRAGQDTGFDRRSIAVNKALTPESAALVIRPDLDGEETVLFDLAMIKSFPQHTFETNDPWTDSRHTYTGAYLRDLLSFAKVGKEVEAVEVLAENEYRVPIRMVDLVRYDYILAHTRDGERLADRSGPPNMGSLVVAINFDEHSEMDVDLHKHQLVWQVKEIAVIAGASVE